MGSNVLWMCECLGVFNEVGCYCIETFVECLKGVFIDLEGVLTLLISVRCSRRVERPFSVRYLRFLVSCRDCGLQNVVVNSLICVGVGQHNVVEGCGWTDGV